MDPIIDPLVTPDTLVSDSGGALKMGDPRLQAACDGASAAVRRFCRWHVAPTVQETCLVDGTGGRVLWLPSQHVTGVESVTVLGEEIGEDEFSWSQSGLIELHSRRVFPKRYRSVEVTFTHGFDDAPDLVGIASQIARFALASPMGRTREQAGQVAVSWGAAQGMAWSESNLEMMKPYRLQVMP